MQTVHDSSTYVASFSASQDLQVDANGMARAIPAVAARTARTALP